MSIRTPPPSRHLNRLITMRSIPIIRTTRAIRAIRTIAVVTILTVRTARTTSILDVITEDVAVRRAGMEMVAKSSLPLSRRTRAH